MLFLIGTFGLNFQIFIYGMAVGVIMSLRPCGLLDLLFATDTKRWADQQLHIKLSD